MPPAVSGEVRPGTPVARFRGSDGKELTAFHLELAIEPWEQTRGLMFRRTLQPGWGMLFVYPGEGVRSFWMKNTLIPLDMVHLDASGRVVGVVEGAEPLTLQPRRTGKPARYVLELNAGAAAKHGLEPGVVMTLENVDPAVEPR